MSEGGPSSLALPFDGRDHGVELHHLAFLGAHFAQQAGIGGFDLNIDLVGFDFEQRLAFLNRFPFPSEPPDDFYLIAFIARPQTGNHHVLFHRPSPQSLVAPRPRVE